MVTLIRQCGASIHDLSRVTHSYGTFRVPRFNMPFELGIAYMISRERSTHRVFVLEERQFRLQHSLSDLNAIDPYIHGGKPDGIGRCLCNIFSRSGGNPSTKSIQALISDLRPVSRDLASSFGGDDIFQRAVFHPLVAAAVSLARGRGLIS